MIYDSPVREPSMVLYILAAFGCVTGAFLFTMVFRNIGQWVKDRNTFAALKKSKAENLDLDAVFPIEEYGNSTAEEQRQVEENLLETKKQRFQSNEAVASAKLERGASAQ